MNIVSESCLSCPIYLDGKFDPIFGRGAEDADIVLIGEAPGKDEVKSRQPFTGQSGKLLGDLIRDSGLSNYKLRVENSVLCRPRDKDDNNRTPTSEEVFSCRGHLEARLNSQTSKRAIIPLGNIALQSLRKLKKASGILKARGIPAYNDEFNCHEIPTLHPANLLRASESIPLVLEDLKSVVNIIERKEDKKPVAYGVVDTWEKFEKLMSGLRRAGRFSFDLETCPYDEDLSTGFDYLEDEILCISFSWAECVGIVLPLFQYPNHVYWGTRTIDVILALKDLFEDESIKKLVHNALFDVPFLKGRFGIEVKGLEADTMLMHFYLDENSAHGLKELAARLTDMGDYDAELDRFFSEIPKIKQRHYGKVPHDILYRYAAADTDACFRLYNIFKRQMNEEPGLVWLHDNIVIPLIHVISDMSYNGVTIDLDMCRNLHLQYTEKMKSMSLELQARANYPINPRSNDHVKAFLYGHDPKELGIESLGLRTEFLTKTGSPSTGKDAMQVFLTKLKELRKKKEDVEKEGVDDYASAILHRNIKQEIETLEFAKKIQEYRSLANLDSTYVVGLAKKADRNNRLHAGYRMHGTITTRLACRAPNLQNIPRNKGGVKTVFTPDSPEYVFLDADFSQAELRGMAMMARETALIEAFNEDIDVHCLVAAECYGTTYEEVLTAYETLGFDERRNVAKAVNFGLIYGRTARALSEAFRWPLEQGEEFVKKYFERFPYVARWMESTKKFAHETGWVESWFGSKRRLPNLKSSNLATASEAERQAINAPVQATAAQFTYLAMIDIDREVKKRKLDAQIKITVHDSIVTQVRREDVEEMTDIILTSMQKPRTNYRGEVSDVEMKAVIELVERWGEEKHDKEDDSDVMEVLSEEQEEFLDEKS